MNSFFFKSSLLKLGHIFCLFQPSQMNDFISIILSLIYCYVVYQIAELHRCIKCNNNFVVNFLFSISAWFTWAFFAGIFDFISYGKKMFKIFFGSNKRNHLWLITPNFFEHLKCFLIYACNVEVSISTIQLVYIKMSINISRVKT